MDYTPRTCIACAAVYVPIRDPQRRCSPCSQFKSKKRATQPPEKACEQCGNVFQPKTILARYCSTKCQQRAKYSANPYNIETFGTGGRANKGVPQKPEHKMKRVAALALALSKMRRNCVKCNEEFTPTLASQKYCSGRCWVAVDRVKKVRSKQRRVSITKDHYDVLLSLQDGKCRICGVESGSNNRGDKLAVDHCHSSGKIRGLLCHKCNTALGLFKDSQASLQAALAYLREAEAR